MKKIILFFFFVALTGNTGIMADNPTPTEEIIIVETGTTPPVLKSIGSSPFYAWLINGKIDLAFISNIGTATIIVAGPQGIIYQVSLAAAAGAGTLINAENWNAGDYTIIIVRASDGKTYEGDFEL
jgi:hypothetical protein